MNGIKNIIMATGVFLAVVIPAYADIDKCLKYEPTTIELTGIIKAKTFPGPPEYRSVKEGDKTERYWILYLSHPICTEGDPNNDINEEEKNVRKLQLIFYDYNDYDKYMKLLGSQVTVSGTLTHAITGHHHTDVLINVKEIKKAQSGKGR